MVQAPPELAKLATEEVPCPLCGADDSRLLSTQLGRFGVVKCGRCGLVRLSPRLTADVARGLYDATYYDAAGYDDYVRTFKRFRGPYEKLFAKRLALLNRHVPGPGRILEAGCAHGFQLEWLRRQGWEVAGNDISGEAAAYARQRLGLEVVEGPLEEAALEPASFDAVYLVDILEHLYDLAAALANVRTALKPGGVILVQVPYELYHWEKLGQALWEGKKAGTVAPDAVPFHVTFFTPRTLKSTLRKCGFRALARYSGNYGAIRQRLSPPKIKVDSAVETSARFIYYKLGLRAALQTAALWFKQGSGIIYVATPEGV